jgi:transcriptional regulator GlxA family with amidase domain
MTLWECLTLHRVWHAQRLLAASDMKVRQVAAASGFNSPSRFYIAFERIVGQLPRDYRASVRISARRPSGNADASKDRPHMPWPY